MGVKKKYEICPKALHKLFSVNRSYKFYLMEWVIVCHTHHFSWLHVFTFFFFFSWKLLAPPSQCHHRLRCRKILWLYNHVMWYSDPSEQEKLAQSELWPVDEPIGFSGWQRCPQSDQKPVNKGGQNGGASAQLINGTFNTVSTHLDHTTSLYIDLNAAQFG